MKLEIRNISSESRAAMELIFEAQGWQPFAPRGAVDAGDELSIARARHKALRLLREGKLEGWLVLKGERPMGWCSLGISRGEAAAAEGLPPLFWVQEGPSRHRVGRALLRASLCGIRSRSALEEAQKALALPRSKKTRSTFQIHSLGT